MRSKVTVVLLFLNVILFFYIFQYEEKWRAEQKTFEARRRVLGPEAASIDAITRTSRAGPPIRLERRGDAWWLTRPYEWPADPNAVARIINELQFLEHEPRDHQRRVDEARLAHLGHPAVNQGARVDHDQRHVHLVGHEAHVGNDQIEFVLAPQRDDRAEVGADQEQRQLEEIHDLRVAVLEQGRGGEEKCDQRTHRQAERQCRQSPQGKALEQDVHQHDQHADQQADEHRPETKGVPLLDRIADQPARGGTKDNENEADGQKGFVHGGDRRPRGFNGGSTKAGKAEGFRSPSEYRG